MKFNTWKIAKIYLENFAKQEGFYFRKRRCVCDPVNNSIIHHHTFECSHIQKHEAKKVALITNQRNRDSEIICEHNHPMNPFIRKSASRFR
ncbi:9451_t:CDS:2 [Funneliformis geosporum]|uniref:9451_t:CDS:1 n=1 Tax=Funneliformis geosporum TaxID=1117311 RepID=A0A9W4T1D1_9GLOM|nr:9451_t:CDS:2 [Funneliformis geosporum]